MVLEHPAMTDFCGIPLAALRQNSITELNLNDKGIGVPGSIVLSELLPSAAALTSLKCVATPGSPRMSAPDEDFPWLAGSLTIRLVRTMTPKKATT